MYIAINFLQFITHCQKTYQVIISYETFKSFQTINVYDIKKR